MTCGKGPLPTLGEDRALLMPIRGGNGARFRRKCIADHAPPLPDEVARGVHGSFTGESGRGARISAIGRSFTGKVALGRCGERFATALAGAGSPRRAGGRGLSRLVSAQATRSGRRGGRSWPSQSEAGAARTRFPRRPHNGWRHRASLRPQRGGGIARAPSVFQRHLPHSGQVSGLFPIGYLCKTTRD